MNNLILSILISLTLASCGGDIQFDKVDPTIPFVSEWEISGSGETVVFDLPATLNATSLQYKFVIDWGDGQSESILTSGRNEHTYDAAGTYFITMSGLIEGFSLYNTTSANKLRLRDIPELGHNGWVHFGEAFLGCSNLRSVSGGDFSNVVTASNIFHSASLVEVDTSSWDTGSLENAGGMFEGAVNANPDVSKWNTSNVENISFMFQGATSATPDVRNWDTSKVTSAWHTFRSATAATPDVSLWDTSLIADMRGIFNGAVNANPDMSSWDFSSMTQISNLLINSNISKDNYDSFLISSAASATATAQALGNIGVSGSLVQYDSSVSGDRSTLTTGLSWTINDGGVAP